MEEKPLLIDVDSVLRAKLKDKYRYVPKCLINWLRKTVREEEMNEYLKVHGTEKNGEFSTTFLQHLGIKVTVKGEENIPADSRNVIFASNHPLGGLDGVALIKLFCDRYGSDRFRFLVNDILLVLKPYGEIFLPINKHGGQSRKAVEQIEEAMGGDYAIATFPAGLCSRNTHGNVIEDLQWQKAFIMKARQYHRDIIPIHFIGHNSKFFYRLSRVRKALHIPFNIEMLYLPAEMFKNRNSEFTVVIGKPIPWQSLDNSRTPLEWAAHIRSMVYEMN